MSVRNVLARSEAIPALGICGGMAAMLWPTSSLLSIEVYRGVPQVLPPQIEKEFLQ